MMIKQKSINVGICIINEWEWGFVGSFGLGSINNKKKGVRFVKLIKQGKKKEWKLRKCRVGKKIISRIMV